MMLKVTKDFRLEGIEFKEGQIAKLSTRQWKQVQDSVTPATREEFTKVVTNKETKVSGFKKKIRIK